MLTDTKVIQRHEGHQVLAQRYEVEWKDGSSVWLHALGVCGIEDPFLRAIQHQPNHWIVVDLRDLARSLEADIKRLRRQDAIGVVFYTLRLGYASAAAFLAAAIERNKAAWFAGPPGFVGMAQFAHVPVEPDTWLHRMAGAAA